MLASRAKTRGADCARQLVIQGVRRGPSTPYVHLGRLVLILALVGVAGGCPTGAYRERLDKRLDQLRRGDPNADLLSAAANLPGTSLWLRVPTQFTVAMSPGGPESMKRKMPPVTVPGLVGTWEASVAEPDGTKMPCYFYAAIIDKAQNPPDPTAAIQQEIQQLWQGVSAPWQDVADGAGRPWRRLRIDGEQDWVPLDKDGKEMPSRAMPGTLQFDCREDGGFWIIAGWRVPRSIEGAAKLDQVMAPTLAALQVQSPGQAPK
jgi:hypothetical protein